MRVGASFFEKLAPTRGGSVGATLPRAGVEDVHLVRVGGDVDRLPLLHVVTTADPDDDVVRSALDAARAVHVGVRAEVLDHGHADRQALVAVADDAPRLGAHPDGDVAL